MKLAIVIEGDQNSGKTSTIRELISLYTDRSLIQMRVGWQSIYLNPIFKYLRLTCYCVPSSPSESNTKIGDRLNKLGVTPEVLIIAEQPNGKNYSDTYNFLNTNNYTIHTYTIINQNGISDWGRFDSNSKSSKLKNRADEIIDNIKNFTKQNNIV
jgi:hypothetical protein